MGTSKTGIGGRALASEGVSINGEDREEEFNIPIEKKFGVKQRKK